MLDVDLCSIFVSFCSLYCLMIRRTPRATRTHPLFPYTPLFPSVCQRFPRTADAGLAHAPKQQPYVADHDRHQRHHLEHRHAIAAVAAHAPVQHQPAADDAHHHDPEQHPDQSDVQAHVAVEDVAELMRDHALQLVAVRSEEHTSELQSLMRISYAVFCLKKKIT